MKSSIASTLFENESIRFDLLRERAFNLRWASVEKDVIPLTAADPDFPCAPEIAEAIARYAKDRYLSYAPAEGLLFFREALAHNYSAKRGVPVSPDGVIACDSAAFGIQAVCKAILGPGDEAVIFNPVDFLFKHCIEACGASALSWDVPLTPDGACDWNLLEELISPNTRLLCLCNPLNPTGKVFLRNELLALAAIAEKHNLIILSDEIWSDIIFSPSAYLSIAALPEAMHRTVIVTGFSKSYGLAGLRAGAVLSTNPKLLENVMLASDQRSTVHGCNVLAQVAATSALNEAQYWLKQFLEHLHRMRTLTVESLNAIPGVQCAMPQGCYVAFADVSGTAYSAQELRDLWYNEARISVVPGLPRWFGSRADGHIRISFATSEHVLQEAFQRINNCMHA